MTATAASGLDAASQVPSIVQSGAGPQANIGT